MILEEKLTLIQFAL